jgi:hypothetical protein
MFHPTRELDKRQEKVFKGRSTTQNMRTRIQGIGKSETFQLVSVGGQDEEESFTEAVAFFIQ